MEERDPYAGLKERSAEAWARVMPEAPARVDGDRPADLLARFVMGEVWSRPHLSQRERRLVTLAVIGIAAAPETIELHIRGALDAGDLSEADLEEFALHFGCYAGSPRMSAFGRALRAALASRDGASTQTPAR
jgi:alkylhydroperoxidase/carboxymuconolactone decarboxylase family protein YurZ